MVLSWCHTGKSWDRPCSPLSQGCQDCSELEIRMNSDAWSIIVRASARNRNKNQREMNSAQFPSGQG